MKILLGSNSSRRKELLKEIGFDFEVVKIDCDEVFPENTNPENVAAYLSELKSSAFRELKADEVLITADTVVVLENQILGKPENEKSAFAMLKKLSGNEHFVYSAFTVKTTKQKITKTDVAKVFFDAFTEEEISYYISYYRPFDKAGSYGIQDWLGMTKIKKIEGSFYTIMGLPTHFLYSILSDIKFS